MSTLSFLRFLEKLFKGEVTYKTYSGYILKMEKKDED